MRRLCAIAVLVCALAVQAAAQTKLEAEDLTVSRCSSGGTGVQNLLDDGYASEGQFSGNTILHWADAEGPGAVLELALPVEAAGKYTVTVGYAKARDYGIHQFLVNGKPAGSRVDMFNGGKTDQAVPASVSLGTLTLRSGDNVLALKVVGTNPNAVPGHGAGIDWVKLTAVGGVTGGGSGDGDDDASVTGAKIEADRLRVVKRSSGEVARPNLAEDGYADPGTFTGNRSLQWHDAAGPGAVLELAVDVAKAGRYSITLRCARYRTYAIHQVVVNGKPVGKPIDMFGNPGQDIVTAFTVNVGAAQMTAGPNRIGLKVVRTNAETVMANHGAGIDWIILKPAAGPR